MSTLLNGEKERLDSVGDVEDDNLSDIEDVVDKVTDKLGLFLDKINPIVDPDKVLLDLTPEDQDALKRSFQHIDLPVKNLVEIVHINHENYLKDSSTDSFSSSSSYDIVPDTNAFHKPDTPPDTPTKDQDTERYGHTNESVIAELKRQTSEALSEKVVETMEAITDLLSGLEETEGFRIINEAYVLETGDDVESQSSMVLQAESLSDCSQHLDTTNVRSVECAVDMLKPVNGENVQMEVGADVVISTDNDTTEGTTYSHDFGCETCDDLSAESLVSEPEQLITVIAQNIIAVNSQPILEELQTEVQPDTKQVIPTLATSSSSSSDSESEKSLDISFDLHTEGELYKPREVEILAKHESHSDSERGTDSVNQQLRNILVKQYSVHSSNSSDSDSTTGDTALKEEVDLQKEELPPVDLQMPTVKCPESEPSVAVMNGTYREVTLVDAEVELDIDIEELPKQECVLKSASSTEHDIEKSDSSSSSSSDSGEEVSHETPTTRYDLCNNDVIIEEISVSNIMSTSIVSSNSSLAPDEMERLHDVNVQIKQTNSIEIIVERDDIPIQLATQSEDQLKSESSSSSDSEKEENAANEATDISHALENYWYSSVPETNEIEVTHAFESEAIVEVPIAMIDTKQIVDKATILSPDCESAKSSMENIAVGIQLVIPSKDNAESTASSSSDNEETEEDPNTEAGATISVTKISGEFEEIQGEHQVLNQHEYTIGILEANQGISEDPIPIPSAVLKRSVSRSSSLSSSSSDSEEAEIELAAGGNFVNYDALSDHSSFCSESDLRESMQRFQDINMALSKSDYEPRENESPGTELEIITPDLHIPDNIDYHNSTVEAIQEFDEETTDIHIPLSVILSNESSRKSSKASISSLQKSSHSSITSDKKSSELPSPRVIIDKGAIDILMNLSIESDEESHAEIESDPNFKEQISPVKDSIDVITNPDVKAFVDCQIKTAVAKTLVDDQIAAVIADSVTGTQTNVPNELSKHDSLEEIPEQIVIVNSTFGILSDVPDVQLDMEKIKPTDDASRKYSDSSSDNGISYIPDIDFKSQMHDRAQFSPSSTLSSHSDDQQSSGDERKKYIDVKIDVAANTKSSNSSEDLKSSSSVSLENSIDLADVIDLNSESVASSSDFSIKIEEAVSALVVEPVSSVIEPKNGGVFIDTDRNTDRNDISVPSSEAHADKQTPEDDLDGKIGKNLSNQSTSERDTDSDGDSKTLATDNTEVTEIIDFMQKLDETSAAVDNGYERRPDESRSIETVLHVHTPDLPTSSIESIQIEDPESDRYGILKVFSETEIRDQSSEDERYAKIEKDSNSQASSEMSTDSDSDAKIIPLEFEENSTSAEKLEKTSEDVDEVDPTNEESETIDKVLMVNTPDLLDEDDDSMSEDDGFCQSDALQSILDRMTSSTISVTEDRLMELETEEDSHSTSSSSSRSTVARIEDEDTAGAESPEPPFEPTKSGLTSSPEPSNNNTPTSENVYDDGNESFATPEPVEIQPERSDATYDEASTPNRELQNQESIVASEILMLLSNSMDDEIMDEPFVATLISSVDSLDLNSTIKTSLNTTFSTKDKLYLKTKFPKQNPVIGKSFLIACKVKMTGFTLKPKDVKNNAQIRLYRDHILLSIQPKFKGGYFIYKIKNPTLGESGVYRFVVNLLEYEADAEEDINIVVKGVKRSKSMSSIGSLGSLGSLFNNRTSGNR